jgi:hypothetical protein
LKALILKKSAQNKRQLLTEIEELLERISIPVRHEKGDFHGGLCTYKGQTTFIINKRLSIDQKLNIAKSELKNLDLDSLYLRPQLRDFLEKKE